MKARRNGFQRNMYSGKMVNSHQTGDTSMRNYSQQKERNGPTTTRTVLLNMERGWGTYMLYTTMINIAKKRYATLSDAVLVTMGNGSVTPNQTAGKHSQHALLSKTHTGR